MLKVIGAPADSISKKYKKAIHNKLNYKKEDHSLANRNMLEYINRQASIHEQKQNELKCNPLEHIYY